MHAFCCFQNQLLSRNTNTTTQTPNPTNKEVSEGACLDPLTGSKLCGHELSTNVAMLFLVNDFGSRTVINSFVLPALRSRFFKRRTTTTTNSNNNAKEAEKDHNTKTGKSNSNDPSTSVSSSRTIMGPVETQYLHLSKYDPTSELILDYIELYVQWGYLTMFGAACPFVVLFALITNYIQSRSGGVKLFRQFRRVLPNRVDGIGEPLAVSQSVSASFTVLACLFDFSPSRFFFPRHMVTTPSCPKKHHEHHHQQ
jgi:hypothetical protein